MPSASLRSIIDDGAPASSPAGPQASSPAAAGRRRSSRRDGGVPCTLLRYDVLRRPRPRKVEALRVLHAGVLQHRELLGPLPVDGWPLVVGGIWRHHGAPIANGLLSRLNGPLRRS